MLEDKETRSKIVALSRSATHGKLGVGTSGRIQVSIFVPISSHEGNGVFSFEKFSWSIGKTIGGHVTEALTGTVVRRCR